MIKLKRFAAKTDQGPFLNINEDNLDVDLSNKLFQVIDGFGGINAGDKASSYIKDQLKNLYTKITEDPDSTLPFFYSSKYLVEGNALINAIHNAHKNLINENKEKDFSKRGGASAIFGALSENILTLASIGNCLCFLIRRGDVTQVTKPQNFEQLSKDNYKNYQLTLPTNGLGLFDDIQIDIQELRLRENDYVLLMSDGACNRIKMTEISGLLNQSYQELDQFIENLFMLNNERGNLDNQTALILHF
ncbi:MAG: SpoIIE family protein phosphatase [Bdellovibrionales bacterium]|jgi:serine/threonine protein phosphatase PrpC|nr:SpoIIE family protein phosphatase [Bdellovibrionales bacterium]